MPWTVLSVLFQYWRLFAIISFTLTEPPYISKYSVRFLSVQCKVMTINLEQSSNFEHSACRVYLFYIGVNWLYSSTQLPLNFKKTRDTLGTVIYQSRWTIKNSWSRNPGPEFWCGSPPKSNQLSQRPRPLTEKRCKMSVYALSTNGKNRGKRSGFHDERIRISGSSSII